MSQSAAAEYVRPIENNEPHFCKNCKHSITDHLPDFKTGKVLPHRSECTKFEGRFGVLKILVGDFT